MSKMFGLWPNRNPPTLGNNTGASRLTKGASRPNKELACVEKNVRPAAGNNTDAWCLTKGASRPERLLSYVKQHFFWAIGRIKTRLRQAITQELRALLRAFLRLTKGASHLNKELAYDEQNSGELKPACGRQ